MRMALIQLCCCWSSLRSACYASAFYTLIYFTVTIAMVAIFGVADIEQHSLAELEHDGIFNINNSSQVTTEDPQTLQALNICVVTLAGFGLVSTLVLLFGLCKNERKCFLPWIGVVTGTTTVDLIYAIYLLIHVESLNPVTAMVFTGDFVLVVINIYSILCVISLYQELKDHRSARRMAGLAVADDEYDGHSQPVVEEFKLNEFAGCNSQSGDGVLSVGQSSQLVEVEACWLDYRPDRRTTNGQQQHRLRPNPSEEELPSGRRVTFDRTKVVDS